MNYWMYFLGFSTGSAVGLLFGLVIGSKKND